MDNFNQFMVSVSQDRILIANGKVLNPMTKDEALRLAAWLVVMAGKEDQIAAMIEAVES